MKISIRNYRGCARADIVLEPIALVVGRNGQGKSSIAQAVVAVLTGTPIVIPGFTKKDAKKLLHDGAEEGGVLLTEAGKTRTITYPKCEVAGELQGTASELAVGLAHVFDMKADDRARVLAAYIKAVPSQDDVFAAVLDMGYAEPTAGRVWESVKGGTSKHWDDTWALAREYGTKEKGKWETITGEAYGSKKAAEWKPAALPESTDRERLVDHVNAAKQRVDAVIGAAAVSADEIERLKKQVAAAAGAEDLKPVQSDREKTQESLAMRRAERQAMPSEAAGHGNGNEQRPCPACNATLVIEKVYNEPTKLSVFDEKAAAAAAKHDNRKDRAKLDGLIANLKSAIDLLQGRYSTAKRLIDDGAAATARLAEIGENGGSGPEAIAAAKAALTVAQNELKALDDKTKADDLHVAISRNDKLIAMLAPDGLRRRVLAKALDAFNARLATLSEVAGWPSVRFDEVLIAHYGQRPVNAASHSEQWRARVIVQIALAHLDGSVAVVIDNAETMIDAQSRSGLFTVLQGTGLKAVVCMAFGKPDSVPNLAAAGMGKTYWVSGGVCSQLGA